MAKLTEVQKRRRDELAFVRRADPLSQDELNDITDILRRQAGSLFEEKWHWRWVARLIRTVEHRGKRRA